MNAIDRGVTEVQLDAATNLTASANVALIEGSTAGGDVIALGGKNETVVANGSGDTLIGFSGGADTFKGTAANLNGASITNFGLRGDVLDITDIAYPSWKPTFVEDKSNTFGTLTVQNGSQVAKVILFGQFTAANFHAASDGGAGEMITYSPPIPQPIAPPGP
jgi:hypothetical protein